ncbi:MAG: bifunctional methylenetetrahydrofolate dehydrogenase/methenyltetrahydrofolate cyclohydrolase FolD [Acidobacteriaceae bacterium]
MAGIVLDGKAYAKELEKELSERVRRLMQSGLTEPPVLATILVGDDPASATYVRMKGNACRRVGMESLSISLPGTTTTEELLGAIDELNANPRVRGILLQHPVPKQIDERVCFDRIALEKDVDGVTAHGFGRMAMDEPAYGSATPAGIMRLLRRYQIPIEGREAVVVGRSPILGRPMAMMLLAANATVTICHSRTKNLPEVVRRGEIIVGAVGKAEFIRGEWIRDGAVVVDAGYHPGGVGDVEMAGVIDRCSAYTPVPGGVGPMTIATLIAHTAEAAERAAG